MAVNENLKQMFSSPETIILGALAFYKLLVKEQNEAKNQVKPK